MLEVLLKTIPRYVTSPSEMLESKLLKIISIYIISPLFTFIIIHYYYKITDKLRRKNPHGSIFHLYLFTAAPAIFLFWIIIIFTNETKFGIFIYNIFLLIIAAHLVVIGWFGTFSNENDWIKKHEWVRLLFYTQCLISMATVFYFFNFDDVILFLSSSTID